MTVANGEIFVGETLNQDGLLKRALQVSYGRR